VNDKGSGTKPDDRVLPGKVFPFRVANLRGVLSGRVVAAMQSSVTFADGVVWAAFRSAPGWFLRSEADVGLR
jgi:hypothetical protein